MKKITLMARTFGTAPGHAADILILITPGLERFGYFRLLERLSKGEATLEELMASQDPYDNHFLDSPVWWAARVEGSASSSPLWMGDRDD